MHGKGTQSSQVVDDADVSGLAIPRWTVPYHTFSHDFFLDFLHAANIIIPKRRIG
jgi:hypothetical protein